MCVCVFVIMWGGEACADLSLSYSGFPMESQKSWIKGKSRLVWAEGIGLDDGFSDDESVM